MTALNVSSVVGSILEAFTNGMNIFNRMQGRKSKKRSKMQRPSEEELKLRDSLSTRPKEIKSEYSQSVVKHGKRFEQGDNQAYSSLAHTLLVLNTGLINLINNALASDIVDVSKSRQSLLLLSESAAANTMQALSQLNTRLSVSSEIVLAANSKQTGRKSTKPLPGNDAPTRPPPSPLLARGGWVRSKSGSSVVSAASARRQAAQKVEHNRSKSSSAIPKRSVRTAPSQDLASERSNSPTSEQSHSRQPSLAATEEKWLLDMVQQSSSADDERPHSMLLVPADYFDNQNENEKYSPPPPIPPKIPLYARSNARTRPRPPSTATFLTASTKIGEIPEHKWPDRVLSEEEREELPLPYVLPPPLQPVRPKCRGLKFWKRPQRVGIGASS